MEMKKNIVLIGLLLQFLMVVAQVQIDNKPGFIVLANNDTVYGELKQLPYPSLISKVVFKAKDALVDTTYTTEAIKSFHFEPNVTFEAIEIRSIRQKDTTDRKYFALRKLSGTVDFFILYMPDSEERYFVRSTDYGLTELKQPIETVYNKVYSNKRYLSVLTKYLGGVPEFQSKVLNCSYYEGSFVKLISAYNDYFSGTSTKEPKKEFKYDLYFTGGLDNYLSEFINSNRAVYGMNLGLEASFSNKKKNLRSEFILGLKYRAFTCVQKFNALIKRDTVQISSPFQGVSNTYYLYNESLKVIQTGQVFGLPMYLRYNNRLKKISPVFEGGLEPFLISTYYNAGNRGSFQSKLDFGFNWIIGIGLALNQERFRMKYMVYADPFLLNTVSVQFKL